MAKNLPDKKNVLVMIQRHLNEPHMPHLAENKLDHAMFELRNARQEVLRERKKLLLSIALNFLMFCVIAYLIK